MEILNADLFKRTILSSHFSVSQAKYDNKEFNLRQILIKILYYENRNIWFDLKKYSVLVRIL